jgi:hypothetical protein
MAQPQAYQQVAITTQTGKGKQKTLRQQSLSSNTVNLTLSHDANLISRDTACFLTKTPQRIMTRPQLTTPKAPSNQ